MAEHGTITLEAVGEFPFKFYIEKAVPTEENEDLMLEGIASTTNIDHDKERMSKEALRAMEATINKDGVPLRVEHQKDATAIIGRVFKAWVDDRNQLHVRARLDKSHPVSPILHSSMKQGSKMGLSVGGIVKRAVKEFSESTGGMVKTFYDVALNEVSVTPRPANYDSWLMAKSIAKNENEIAKYRDSEGLYETFLFENPHLDYLQAFAKSVPDAAWRKVEASDISKDTKIMAKDDVQKKEGDTEETTKAVSRAEFASLSKAVQDLIGVVSKGFESVTGMVKAMDGAPKDAVNPDKTKPEDATQQTAKTSADGTDTDGTREKASTETDETTKAEDKTDETTKASDDKDETTKAGESKDDTYDLETINRTIKSIEGFTARVKKAADDKTDETTKAEDKTDETTKAEDTEETTKGIHPIDQLAVTIAKAFEVMETNLAKSGRRVLGFEKSIIDKIQNDPQMQAELSKLLKLPGFKKSVAMGVPYMVTKDGKRYPLMPQAEAVEKSSKEDEGKSFKDVYKSKYSSVLPETNG